MSKLLFTINEVFTDYLTKDNKNYHIPEYQRGYKWSSQQIEQLLVDISEFETGGDESLFYCLQNITLVTNEQDIRKINVVDGQQRLTTITLLLTYLGEQDLVEHKINYAVRDISNTFLQQIICKQTGLFNCILESSSFDTFVDECKTNHTQDYDYQDIYYMYSAIRTIDKWFKNKEEDNKHYKIHFKDKLLTNVKLIVNNVSGVSEQELFMNLNAGKVQLDGSDLVRAILITRVAKKEMEEFDSNEVQDVVKLNERRIRIGWELDELNRWWSKPEVFTYFSFFSKTKTGEKETIKFDKQKHPINLLYEIWVETLPTDKSKNKQEDIKLSLFEAKNTDALTLYTSITLLHRTVKDWFEDREIYHFLGYLFAQNTSFSFKKVWAEWTKAHSTRKEFIDIFLKNQLKESVFGSPPNEKNEETGLDFWLDKITDFDKTEEATNWKSIPQLQKILLLLDIIELSKEKEKGNPLPKLKSKYFRNQKEDEEHIFPSTPKDIQEIASLENPVQNFKDYIEKLNFSYEDNKRIEWQFDLNEWNDLDDEKKSEKLNALKKEIHEKRPINSIGNLVLLHQKINRGFGNNYYPQKRITVVQNTEEGLYVRNHTLKVFTKQIDNKDLNEWTIQDIKHNACKIRSILQNFFNVSKNEKKKIILFKGGKLINSFISEQFYSS